MSKELRDLGIYLSIIGSLIALALIFRVATI